MPGTRPLLMPHALFAKPPKNLARRPQLEDARDIVRGAGLPNLHLRTTDGLPAPGLSIGAIVATTSSRKIAIEIPTTDAVYDCCLNTNIRRSLLSSRGDTMASLGEDLLGVVNKLQDLVFNTIGSDSLDLPQIVRLAFLRKIKSADPSLGSRRISIIRQVFGAREHCRKRFSAQRQRHCYKATSHPPAHQRPQRA